MLNPRKEFITIPTVHNFKVSGRNKTFMQIEVGTVVSGKVTGITEFGAFIDFEGGKTGMVHISEISTGFVKDIKDHLQVGQEVKAKVISISPEGKISLSIRRAEANSGGDEEARDNQARKPAAKRSSDGKGGRGSAPRVWQGQNPSPKTGEKQSFEDMMAKFKQVSDEKMSDLKRNDSKRGSVGYSRRGKG